MNTKTKIDLRAFQTHLLKNGYKAKASPPSRREESRARFDRDMWRGRARKPQSLSPVTGRLSDHDGQLYDKMANGQIRLARVDSPKTQRRAITELRRAGVPKRTAKAYVEQMTKPALLPASSTPPEDSMIPFRTASMMAPSEIAALKE